MVMRRMLLRATARCYHVMELLAGAATRRQTLHIAACVFSLRPGAASARLGATEQVATRTSGPFARQGSFGLCTWVNAAVSYRRGAEACAARSCDMLRPAACIQCSAVRLHAAGRGRLEEAAAASLDAHRVHFTAEKRCTCRITALQPAASQTSGRRAPCEFALIKKIQLTAQSSQNLDRRWRCFTLYIFPCRASCAAIHCRDCTERIGAMNAIFAPSPRAMQRLPSPLAGELAPGGGFRTAMRGQQIVESRPQLPQPRFDLVPPSGRSASAARHCTSRPKTARSVNCDAYSPAPPAPSHLLKMHLMQQEARSWSSRCCRRARGAALSAIPVQQRCRCTGRLRRTLSLCVKPTIMQCPLAGGLHRHWNSMPRPSADQWHNCLELNAFAVSCWTHRRRIAANGMTARSEPLTALPQPSSWEAAPAAGCTR